MGLEPRGEAGRVADRREAPLLGGADAVDDCRAGVDADAEPRPLPGSPRQLGALERERGARSPHRMVRLVDGVEDDHDRGRPRTARSCRRGHRGRPEPSSPSTRSASPAPPRAYAAWRRLCSEVGEEDADVPLLAAELGDPGSARSRAASWCEEVRAKQPFHSLDLAGGALDDGGLVRAEAEAPLQLVLADLPDAAALIAVVQPRSIRPTVSSRANALRRASPRPRSCSAVNATILPLRPSGGAIPTRRHASCARTRRRSKPRRAGSTPRPPRAEPATAAAGRCASTATR